MWTGLWFLKYLVSVSYIIPPFWCELPNFSTDLSFFSMFFFSLLEQMARFLSQIASMRTLFFLPFVGMRKYTTVQTLARKELCVVFARS